MFKNPFMLIVGIFLCFLLGCSNGESFNPGGDQKKLAKQRTVRVCLFSSMDQLYYSNNSRFVVKITPCLKGIRLLFPGKGIREVKNFEINSVGDDGLISVAPTREGLKEFAFKGKLLFRNIDGKLDVINTVDIEEYLCGVVKWEIGAWAEAGLEVLKAQAIAARTYVYSCINNSAHREFDCYADERDQGFKGLYFREPLIDQAVKETEGTVITYRNKLINAFYFSTCGGATERCSVFGKPDLPYLKSVSDTRLDGSNWCRESKYSTWERRLKDEEIAELI